MTSREQAKAIKMGADMLSVLGRRYRRCKDLLALAARRAFRANRRCKPGASAPVMEVCNVQREQGFP